MLHLYRLALFQSTFSPVNFFQSLSVWILVGSSVDQFSALVEFALLSTLVLLTWNYRDSYRTALYTRLHIIRTYRYFTGAGIQPHGVQLR